MTVTGHRRHRPLAPYGRCRQHSPIERMLNDQGRARWAALTPHTRRLLRRQHRQMRELIPEPFAGLAVMAIDTETYHRDYP